MKKSYRLLPLFILLLLISYHQYGFYQGISSTEIDRLVTLTMKNIDVPGIGSEF